jgi:hypothetical protein
LGPTGVNIFRLGLGCANAIEHGHEVRAIVADDTRDASGQARCRAALGELGRRRDREIRYAGAIEKRAFLDRVTGVPLRCPLRSPSTTDQDLDARPARRPSVQIGARHVLVLGKNLHEPAWDAEATRKQAHAMVLRVIAESREIGNHSYT